MEIEPMVYTDRYNFTVPEWPHKLYKIKSHYIRSNYTHVSLRAYKCKQDEHSMDLSLSICFCTPFKTNANIFNSEDVQDYFINLLRDY